MIEDNPTDLLLFEQMILHSGGRPPALATGETLTLLKANSLESGLALLDAAQPIHVVVVCLDLPDANGTHVLRSLNTRAPQAAIIVLTDLDDSTIALEALREGVHDYLVKSETTGRVLLRSIRYALERKIAQIERERILRERERLIQQLQEALNSVKTLSGLLPICAGCKKIRDDQGYWNQLESYIAYHSSVQFSHGLCPDCIQRLYPELKGGS